VVDDQAVPLDGLAAGVELPVGDAVGGAVCASVACGPLVEFEPAVADGHVPADPLLPVGGRQC